MQGLRNDFKDAMDKLDQEYLDQLAKHEVHDSSRLSLLWMRL